MTSELARRIAFTLGALFVYRLGTYIRLPGINTSPGRLSIFALNITPYLSVAMLIQLVSMVSSRLNALVGRGDSGRRIIARYTLGLTLLLTAFQAYGIASGLQEVPNAVSDPGALFLLSTTATLLGGMIFLIWLSEQITARGIGNGLALILFTGVAAEMPNTLASLLELSRQGILSTGLLLLLVILSVAVVGLVVFVELARRPVPVEFAARKSELQPIPSQQSYLSIKLNSAGLIPTVVAPWLIFLPLILIGFAFGQKSPWVAAAFKQMEFGNPGHMAVNFIAIAILAFIYTSFVVDPERAAVSLQTYGGAIPGIASGEATAEYLDRVVSGTTAIGAAYLAAIFLLPEALITWANVPYYFGGASVLIVVCTVLDVEAQVRGMSLTGRGGEYA
ncbi:MAG: preprotein translocase subunit SecY [Bradyrhizobium sp.]|jgi:preprotein translocase subunit SecY|nr:preprotein translocase subunit SecY [Bradyrhizobium sp.]